MSPNPLSRLLPVAALGLVSVLPLVSCAQKRVDVEIDPSTYALNGYSVHAGVWADQVRFNLGAFSLDVPEEIHGEEALDVTFHGYGLKVQYFPFAEGFAASKRSGVFVGLDGGVVKRLVRSQAAEEASYRNLYGGGMELGWRFQSRRGFYLTPWVGVGSAFNGEPITVGGRDFGERDWVVFPALHFGLNL